jgi:hypothetical protein
LALIAHIALKFVEATLPSRQPQPQHRQHAYETDEDEKTVSLSSCTFDHYTTNATGRAAIPTSLESIILPEQSHTAIQFDQRRVIVSAVSLSKPKEISLSVAFVVSRQKETLEELG